MGSGGTREAGGLVVRVAEAAGTGAGEGRWTVRAERTGGREGAAGGASTVVECADPDTAAKAVEQLAQVLAQELALELRGHGRRRRTGWTEELAQVLGLEAAAEPEALLAKAREVVAGRDRARGGAGTELGGGAEWPPGTPLEEQVRILQGGCRSWRGRAEEAEAQARDARSVLAKCLDVLRAMVDPESEAPRADVEGLLSAALGGGTEREGREGMDASAEEAR